MHRFPYPVRIKVTTMKPHVRWRRGFSLGFSWRIVQRRQPPWLRVGGGCRSTSISTLHPLSNPRQPKSPAGLFLTAAPRQDRQQPVPLSLGTERADLTAGVKPVGPEAAGPRTFQQHRQFLIQLELLPGSEELNEP